MPAVSTSPAFLNYITDESFRQSLESDHREMTNALENGSWKSVLVLAGSLIEAILVDHLFGRNTDRAKDEEILSLDLYKAIDRCKAAGVLNPETATLCIVIKNYRNLIHPGRIKRLDEKINEERAKVAFSLVKMVADDIAKQQRETYGYTGEQIVAKITNDPEAFPALLSSLLAKVNGHERGRLLFRLLPAENFALRSLMDSYRPGNDHPSLPQRLQCLRHCFSVLAEKADQATKGRVLQQYLSILHDGSELDRKYYEAGLLHSCVFRTAEGTDRSVVKSHLFALLKRGATEDVLKNTTCLGEWLSTDDFETMISIAGAQHQSYKGHGEIWVSNCFEVAEAGLHDQFVDYLHKKADSYSGNQYSEEYASWLRGLANTSDIPF